MTCNLSVGKAFNGTCRPESGIQNQAYILCWEVVRRKINLFSCSFPYWGFEIYIPYGHGTCVN